MGGTNVLTAHRAVYTRYTMKILRMLAGVLLAAACYGQRPELLNVTSSVDPYTRQRWYIVGDSITFFGKNLAPATASASYESQTKFLGGVSLRYSSNPDKCEPYRKAPPGQENKTLVALCGEPLALTYVSPNQINAVVPWGLDLSDRIFSPNAADYLGTVILVREGQGHIRLGRMYPGDDDFWNIWPLDIARSAVRPALVVLGYHRPFTSISQPYAIANEKTDGTGVRFAAMTHPDGTLITTAAPIRNNGRITLWLTGLGEMGECGSTLCANAAQKEALALYARVTIKDALHFFPIKAEFIGSTRDFPWLQQINLQVSLCGSALATTAIPVDARLSFQVKPEADPMEVLMPITIDRLSNGTATASVYEPIKGLPGAGTWKNGVCPVF